MLRPELRPGASAADCSRAFAAVLQQETEFIQAGMSRPDGVVACAAVPPADRVSFADRNYFQQALLAREMVVGDVITGRIVGKPNITFAKAQRELWGSLAQAVGIAVDSAAGRGSTFTLRLPRREPPP